MKISLTLKAIATLLVIAVLFSSCASTTMIRSEPPGADLFLNGERVGITPYTHTDTKIVGTTNIIELKMEGYEDFLGSFSRNEEADIGAIIGGIFFVFPFLWVMKYKPFHNYELKKKE